MVWVEFAPKCPDMPICPVTHFLWKFSVIKMYVNIAACRILVKNFVYKKFLLKRLLIC